MNESLAAFRPELRGTPQARDSARFLLVNPPVPLIVRPAYGLISAAAVAMLPGWARRMLYLPATAADRRRPARTSCRRAGDSSVPVDAHRLNRDLSHTGNTAGTDSKRRLPTVGVVQPNPNRPAHLHAGSVTTRRLPVESRAAWRRHLHNEPPGLLRRLHLVPRRELAIRERSGGPAED